MISKKMEIQLDKDQQAMKQSLLQFLLRFESFLSKAEIQLIVDHSTIRRFKKGTYLLKEGEVAKHCYLVLQGCVREYLVKNGEEKSTAFYTEEQPVNSFTSATNKSKAKHNLVCVEDCILTIGTSSLEEEMCVLIPRLRSVIRMEVEKHTGEFQDEMSKFITSTAEERYQDLLENRPDLFNRVPLHQIASFIGITAESLSRIRKRITTKKS
ncbi:MAG: Crp/Fnr family transcriptional regulator [Bacteroidetes bacterium]|nr:Crp/Fnr family transcriptional regulator [Bacteroidota bacterium]